MDTQLSASPSPLNEPFPDGELVDRERISHVMEKYGLDGFVLAHPINVYQMTKYPSNNLIYQNVYPDSGSIVVVPKDPKRPIALVIPSFTFYYHFADLQGVSNELEVYLVTDVADRTSVVSSDRPPVAASIYTFEDRHIEPLDDIEQGRVNVVHGHAALRPPSPNMKTGLSRALHALGLENGRLGADVALAYDGVSAVAPAATPVDGRKAMAAYRIIKSDVEIAYMRRASRINAEASLAAVRGTVRAGGSYRDLRAAFFSEACRRGNLPLAMIVDRVKRESFNADFHEGQAFLIDAVSHGGLYFGDYGRTIFVGEPTKAIKRATDAIAFASSVIHETIKPGMRFSDVRAVGIEALRKGGYDVSVRFGPHSVGLGHGDVNDLQDPDTMLEPGMIISTDCPVMDAGIGGSAHLEDSVVITAIGMEPLNDTGDKTILV
jgi:Xaa-Pro aminopeptidase